MSPRCLLALPLVAALTLRPVTPVLAESLVDHAPRDCRVRTTDRRLGAAVDRGLRDSPTFRELVNRINASDVVVYVQADWEMMLPPGIDGRLTFLSVAGGFRYVVVRVNTKLSTRRLVSLLGHELQHAREIADSDAIVDSISLAREYGRRLGYRSGNATREYQRFDSDAAIRAGEQVLRELLAGG